MSTIKSITVRNVLIAITAILLITVLFSGSSHVFAFSFLKPQTTEAAKSTEALPTQPAPENRVDTVKSALLTWGGEVFVNEFSSDQIDALRVLAVIGESGEGDAPTVADLASLLEAETKKAYFTYNRIYVDTIDKSGSRIESIEVKPDSFESNVASFIRQDELQTQSPVKEHVMNEPFSVGPYSITVRETYFEPTSDGKMSLNVVFDFTNNSQSETSAFWALEIEGNDGENKYDVDYNLFSGKYMDNVATGDTIEGVTVFFQTESEIPFKLLFKEFLSDAPPVSFEIVPAVG